MTHLRDVCSHYKAMVFIVILGVPLKENWGLSQNE